MPHPSWAFVCAALLLAGCSEANPLGRRAVHGSVSFQGQPIDSGSIRFEPEDLQRGVSSGAVINAGKFNIKTTEGLPPGSYKVMITAPDRVAKEKVEGPPGEEVSLAKDRIPRKYNVKSELKLEVPKARGSHEANFNLQ